jgi:putative phosphoesterase
MKLGLVADVHGNKPALEAVQDAMPDVDGVVCAGDVVGYNPWHAWCLEEFREPKIPTVQGNHDRAVASDEEPPFTSMARAGVDHARKQLSEEQRDWLRALPTEERALDGRVKIVHGHPDDPDHYTYPREFSPDLLGDEDVLVMGHTHVQAHQVYDEGIVMNPGSVGQPRDGDHRAAFAVVDVEEWTVEEHRVEYDTDAVISKVVEEGLPREIGFRLAQGR